MPSIFKSFKKLADHIPWYIGLGIGWPNSFQVFADALNAKSYGSKGDGLVFMFYVYVYVEFCG